MNYPISLDEKHVKIAIIGAGVSGILAGAALRRKLKFTNFLIIERQNDIGGVWNENSYPGCRTDDLVHAYSLSYELKPNWPEYTASRYEYQEYWRNIARRYDLFSHMLLSTNVEEAVWDKKLQAYRLSLHNLVSNAREHIIVHAVVSAVGYLSEPNIPDVPGRDLFSGPSFHSLRWQHDADFHAKRVGVIGNSATAAQVITSLSEDPSVTVVNFCRTPVWYKPHPSSSMRYSSLAKFAFAFIPGVLRIYRTLLFIVISTRTFFLFQRSPWLRTRYHKTFIDHIIKNVPEDRIQQFLPNYAYGCKRPVLDAGILESLRRPNVIVNWEGVDSITTDGIITKSKNDIPLDVIIFCTGYKIGKPTIEVMGTNGELLSEYKKSRGGLAAYLGIAIPHFPNYFFLCGPNGTVARTSIVYSAEREMEYIVQLLKPIVKKKVQSFEVTQDAADAHNAWLNQRFSETILHECASAYNLGGGRSAIIFPGSIYLVWLWTRWPRWDHYRVVGANRRWMPLFGHPYMFSTFLFVSSIALFLCFWYINARYI